MNKLNNSDVKYSHPCHYQNLSWRAILAGSAIALTLGILMNLLGMGLGFSLFTPDIDTLKKLGSLGMFWMFINGIIPMFMGGWAASFLSDITDYSKSYWQGFISASITLFIMLGVAASSVGMLSSGSFRVLEKIFSNSGPVMNQTVSQTSESMLGSGDFSKDKLVKKAKDSLPSSLAPLIDQINYEAEALVDSANQEIAAMVPNADETSNKTESIKNKAAIFKKKVSPAVHRLLESINTDNYPQARQNLIEIISAASGKSATEIKSKIDDWKKKYEDAKAKAADAAEAAANKTAELISRFAMLNFFLILVSVISAGLGGIFGLYCKNKEGGLSR